MASQPSVDGFGIVSGAAGVGLSGGAVGFTSATRTATTAFTVASGHAPNRTKVFLAHVSVILPRAGRIVACSVSTRVTVTTVGFARGASDVPVSVSA